MGDGDICPATAEMQEKAGAEGRNQGGAMNIGEGEKTGNWCLECPP